MSAPLRVAAGVDAAAATRADAPLHPASANPLSDSAGTQPALFDHPLSLCLSFLSARRRFQIAALVCRQWNRAAALSTSNADCVVRLQHPLRDTVQPSPGLLRWASQRAAGVLSSSAAYPLLPCPPSVPFGLGTAHLYAQSSVQCLVAAHLGGEVSSGCVSKLKSHEADVAGPNPPFMHEGLGWPRLARAAYNARYCHYLTAQEWQRRASFESWCRISPAQLESLTIRSPVVRRDADELGGGDGEWIDLMRTVAPAWAEAVAAVAAPSDLRKQQAHGLPSPYSAAAASASAAKLPFDPADSPFPHLRSLTIEGPALSWPVVQALLRACPSIRHLTIVGIDASAECKAACAALLTRGPDASVNGQQLSTSRCSLCGEKAAPLLTCANESCARSACGPCMLSTSDRHHFLCQSDHHDGGVLLYCYPPGPCDDHVDFACPDCIDRGAGDSSPAPCDACGGLACYEHHAYGYCDHFPQTMWRCSRCRCRKCKYCCGEFAGDDGGGEEDEDDEGDADEEDEEEEGEGQQKRKTNKVTHWKHG